MTKVSVRYVTRALGALLLGVAIVATPALAQHGGGGGGGGHMGGGGGAHFGGGAGGGGGHFGGFAGGAHFGGFGGGHSYGGHTFAAPHYGVPGHYYGGYGGHYVASAGHGIAYGGSHFVARSGFVARPGTHPGIGAPSAASTAYWHGGHPWAGGYWHGAYWPHCWYYPGWAWYLPVLPIGYVTYWWGGVPYYYWNSLYYTWSPADSGYVVTNPPPVAGTDEGSSDPNGGYEQAAPQAGYGAGTGDAGDVYVYPRNGQTQEQTQNDRYECHSWAVNQSGFDPTRPEQTGNAADYRRAMAACLDARGYSAR
jgi:hypothetical protein